MELLLQKNIDRLLSRGYFNNIYIERKQDNTYIAKRGNITYTEYTLSDKDIDFILVSLSSIWNLSKTSQEITKKSRGKSIRLVKKDTVSLIINEVTMISNLDRNDSKIFYAILTELKRYGVSNKLM